MIFSDNVKWKEEDLYKEFKFFDFEFLRLIMVYGYMNIENVDSGFVVFCLRFFID